MTGPRPYSVLGVIFGTVLHTGQASSFGGCMALVSYLDTARRPVSFLAKKARFVTTSNLSLTLEVVTKRISTGQTFETSTPRRPWNQYRIHSQRLVCMIPIHFSLDTLNAYAGDRKREGVPLPGIDVSVIVCLGPIVCLGHHHSRSRCGRACPASKLLIGAGAAGVPWTYCWRTAAPS